MTLSILWFILIAVLWTMYLVLEGFDYGVGMLQGFLARNHVLGNVPGTLPHSAGAHRSRLCS